MKEVVYQGRVIPLGNITEYNFKYVKQIPYRNRHGRVTQAGPVGGLPWKEWVEKYANSFYYE